MVTARDVDVIVEFAPADGAPIRTALADASATAIVQGMPVRRFGSYAGMRHYPGWWWSSTNKDLVGYESLLERDRLLVADFDPAVKGIASQPFGITGLVSGNERRHAAPPARTSPLFRALRWMSSTPSPWWTTTRSEACGTPTHP